MSTDAWTPPLDGRPRLRSPSRGLGGVPAQDSSNLSPRYPSPGAVTASPARPRPPARVSASGRLQSVESEGRLADEDEGGPALPRHAPLARDASRRRDTPSARLRSFNEQSLRATLRSWPCVLLGALLLLLLCLTGAHALLLVRASLTGRSTLLEAPPAPPRPPRGAGRRFGPRLKPPPKAEPHILSVETEAALRPPPAPPPQHVPLRMRHRKPRRFGAFMVRNSLRELSLFPPATDACLGGDVVQAALEEEAHEHTRERMQHMHAPPAPEEPPSLWGKKGSRKLGPGR